MKYVLLIYIIIFLLSRFSFGQLSQLQITNKPYKSNDEIITVRDINGKYCAGIQVISDMDGFSYQSYNGVVKVNDQPGRDLVYLQASERVLEIFKSGYEPLKIYLSEYGIQLKPKDVWKIKIKGENDSIRVFFQVRPHDASITIDKKSYSSNKNIKLSKGEHTLKIQRNSYETLNDIISVKQETNYFDYELRPLNSEINFSLNKQYKLFLNNKYIGNVENNRKLIPIGNYSLTLKNNYEIIEEIFHNEDLRSKTITIEKKPKYSFVMQSALIPGLGQITSLRRGIGVIYLGAFSVSSIYYFTALSDYNNKSDQLTKKKNELSRTSDLNKQHALSVEISDLSEEVNSASSKKNITLWIPISVYIVNLLDAIFLTPTKKTIVISQKSNITISPKLAMDVNNDLNISILMRF